MATTVEGLFNLPTAAQAGQQYYEGLLTSPGQMNNLSLLQQISALGANAGAGVGYAGGRLLGGKAPDEVRIQGVNDAMAEATRAGGTDAEIYANLAKGLAARGLTQDAMAATERARTAKRDEQAMTLAASQEARAVSGEGRAVSAEQRQVEADARAKQEFDQKTKLWPDALKKSAMEVQAAEEALRGDTGNRNFYTQALATGVNPSTGQPLTVVEREMAAGKIKDIDTKINTAAAELKIKQDHSAAQLAHWKAMEAQGANANQIAREKMNQENFSQPASIQVDAEFPGAPPVKLYVGAINPKTGKVRGKDGNIYNSVNEAAKEQNIGVPAAAASTTAPASQAPVTDQRGLWDRMMNNPQPSTTPKAPQKPLSEF